MISLFPSVISALTEYLPNVLIVHTSGSTALSVLATKHARAGVFYPLQTFSLEREIDWSNTPLFVEATEKYGSSKTTYTGRKPEPTRV